MKNRILVGAPLLAIASSCFAGSIGNLSVLNVMAGGSSAFTDSVWIRVQGQPAHPNCYYAPGNVTLFYARKDGIIDPNKVLALAASAKLAGRTISLQYDENATTSDFWGYGISSCQIHRISIE